MSPQRGPDSLRRKVVFFLISLSLFVVLVRAFLLQWRSHRELKRLSQRQSFRSVVVVGPRGPIFDAGGAVLASTSRTYYLVAFPGRIRDLNKACAKLSRVLGIPKKRLLKLLSKRGFVRICRVGDKKLVERLKKLDISGVFLAKEYTRVYPRDPLFRWVIGNVGLDMQGICGVEMEYDGILRGKVKKRERVIRDARGYLLLLEPVEDEETEGIKLSLDTKVGSICQEELEETVKRFRAKGGMVVVMEPGTGRILAIVSYPYCKGVGYFRSPVYSRLIEPGSVMKPFVLAEALERGIIALNSTINCGGGRLRISGRIVRDVHPYRRLSARDVVVKSSNVGISRIALMLGPSGMRELLRKLGFDRRTGIDAEGDEKGLLGSFKTDIDVACKGFGQGVSVTLLHIAKAFCAFANGGFIPRPFMGVSKVDERGRVLGPLRTPVLRRAFSEEVADAVKGVLREVVIRGTGIKAALEGFGVCGKTGTAQKLEESGSYSRRRFYSLFVGFFPFEKPRFLIAVMVDEPKGAYYGGDVAAPLFKRIAKRLVAYYGVSPREAEVSLAVERKKSPAKKKVEPRGFPKLIGLSLREALRMLNGTEVVIHGSKGLIVKQWPRPGYRGRFKRCEIYLAR